MTTLADDSGSEKVIKLHREFSYIITDYDDCCISNNSCMYMEFPLYVLNFSSSYFVVRVMDYSLEVYSYIF